MTGHGFTCKEICCTVPPCTALPRHPEGVVRHKFTSDKPAQLPQESSGAWPATPLSYFDCIKNCFVSLIASPTTFLPSQQPLTVGIGKAFNGIGASMLATIYAAFYAARCSALHFRALSISALPGKRYAIQLPPFSFTSVFEAFLNRTAETYVSILSPAPHNIWNYLLTLPVP